MQLGPGLASLVVELHTEMGVPLAKVVGLLRTRLGVQVTTGGLARLLHRAARNAMPVYRELCSQVRNAPVVTPDETGWRVGAIPHWLWAYVTPETTVYAICPGRSFADAATVLGTDWLQEPLIRFPPATPEEFARIMDRKAEALRLGRPEPRTWDPSGAPNPGSGRVQ